MGESGGKLKKIVKNAKMEESDSSGTKVQILQTCFQPCDENSRVLEVNWMKKGVKWVKYN